MDFRKYLFTAVACVLALAVRSRASEWSPPGKITSITVYHSQYATDRIFDKEGSCLAQITDVATGKVPASVLTYPNPGQFVVVNQSPFLYGFVVNQALNGPMLESIEKAFYAGKSVRFRVDPERRVCSRTPEWTGSERIPVYGFQVSQ